MEFVEGQIAYFVANCIFVKKVEIVRVTKSFITIKFSDGGGTRVRASKLFKTKEEAEATVQRYKKQ